MRSITFLALVLFLGGCGSPSKNIAKNKTTEHIYKPTNVLSVEDAKKSLDENRDRRKTTVMMGRDRAKRFEPLILNLIAFYDHGYELNLSDLSPYRSELPHLSAIFTDEETQDFVKYGTEDKINVDSLYNEARKGEVNNKVNEEKDAKIAELQRQIDEKYTEKLSDIATKFLWAGGILLALSIFSSVPAIAPIASKATVTGFTLLAVGGLIILLGTFTEFARDFLSQYGQWLLLLLLIPLIIIFIGQKTHQAIDDANDED